MHYSVPDVRLIPPAWEVRLMNPEYGVKAHSPDAFPKPPRPRRFTKDATLRTGPVQQVPAGARNLRNDA